MGILIGGPTPQDGESAYQLAVDNGFVGTLTQWLASLKGDKGDKGDPGSSGNVPQGTILFGQYNVSDFDSNGVGITGTQVEGFGLADGRLGRVDMRGFIPGGGLNYGSGTLDIMVDPAQHGNDPDYQVNIGTKHGEVKHRLVTTEIPKITPTIVDNGHKHDVEVYKPSGTSAGSLPVVAGSDSTAYTHITRSVELNTTGISINQFGGDEAHNNLQPTKYFIFIQKL